MSLAAICLSRGLPEGPGLLSKPTPAEESREKLCANSELSQISVLLHSYDLKTFSSSQEVNVSIKQRINIINVRLEGRGFNLGSVNIKTSTSTQLSIISIECLNICFFPQRASSFVWCLNAEHDNFFTSEYKI